MHLDGNQLARERMCIALLQLDQRFSGVEPRRPKGGPDGGRDIQARYEADQVVYGAVGFKNTANDSPEQKREIKAKFIEDLEAALHAKPDLLVFAFFTNIDLTPGEVDELTKAAYARGLTTVEVFYRERLRIMLDNTRGLAIRHQFLDLPLSPAEQAAFFAEFGTELHALITSRFQTVDRALQRVEFLQDCCRELIWLSGIIHLSRRYSAVELGHFRVLLRFEHLYRRRAQPECWIAVRDANLRWMDGVILGMGFRHLAGIGESTEVLRNEDLHFEMTETALLQIGGEVPAAFPIQTLGDLDQSEVKFYCNESLLDKITRIELQANTYLVSAVDRKDLTEIFRCASYYWPLPLTARG